MKKKKGFTLAEVLVTLTIIGVVAALTVPLVTANHNKKTTALKLKKAYITIQDAVAQMESDYDMSYRRILASMPRNGGNRNPWDVLSQYIVSTGKAELTCSNDNSCSGVITLNDGIQLYGINSKEVFVDVNGTKGPNRIGVDRFPMLININDLGDYGLKSFLDYERNRLISMCSNYQTSRADEARACFELIKRDGWEIKDDYPRKI